MPASQYAAVPPLEVVEPAHLPLDVDAVPTGYSGQPCSVEECRLGFGLWCSQRQCLWDRGQWPDGGVAVPAQ